MGKKKRGYVPEDEQPGLLDRILANRVLTIVAGIGIVVLSAAVAIVIVTLAGGADLSDDTAALPLPSPIGPPPSIERSAAADVLSDKTWDEMTADERELVRSEVYRVFDSSEFRASNGFVEAVDVYRDGGLTIVSRSYPVFEGAGGEERAMMTFFYCVEGEDVRVYRYFVSVSERDFAEGNSERFPVAWSPVMSGTSWDAVRDVGFREVDGMTLHGLELGYQLPGVQGEPDRVEYWFDVQTARLIERGRILEDEKDTEANWYRLKYDELPAVEIPSDMEQPACVQEILAKVGP